jgi:hypothetical protein
VTHDPYRLSGPDGDLFRSEAFVVDKLESPALAKLEVAQYLLDQDTRLSHRIAE